MNSFSALCVDANLVIRFVLSDDEIIQDLWDSWFADERRLIAPALIHYEVINGLYQYLKYERISSTSFHQAVKTALALPIEIIDDERLEIHRRAAFLTEEYKLKAAYDTHYLALAERLNIELWTADARLYNAVQAQGVAWVKLVEK